MPSFFSRVLLCALAVVAGGLMLVASANASTVRITASSPGSPPGPGGLANIGLIVVDAAGHLNGDIPNTSLEPSGQDMVFTDLEPVSTRHFCFYTFYPGQPAPFSYPVRFTVTDPGGQTRVVNTSITGLPPGSGVSYSAAFLSPATAAFDSQCHSTATAGTDRIKVSDTVGGSLVVLDTEGHIKFNEGPSVPPAEIPRSFMSHDELGRQKFTDLDSPSTRAFCFFVSSPPGSVRTFTLTDPDGTVRTVTHLTPLDLVDPSKDRLGTPAGTTCNGEAEQACSDGVDNDGDGKIDFPADPGCSAATDSDEADQPPPPGRPVAVNDSYRVKPGATLDLPAPGVLFNDRGTGPLAARVIAINFAASEYEWDGDGGLSYTAGPGTKEGLQKRIWYAAVDANGVKSPAARITITITKKPAEPVFEWTGYKEEQALIRRYAPLLIFDPLEQYFPLNPNTFLRDSTLKWHDERRICVDPEVRKITAAKLGTGAYTQRAIKPSGLCSEDQSGPPFASDELTAPGEHDTAGHRPPGTAQGYYLDTGKTGRNKLQGYRIGQMKGPHMYYSYDPKNWIIYWLFYGFNNRTLDKHEGDWEKVIVRLNGQNVATSVGYKAHFCPVEKVPWSVAPKVSGTHPVAWVAKGGHGTQPTVLDRRFPCSIRDGFGDVTGNGSRWKTWANPGVFRDARRAQWYGYGGGWGAQPDIHATDAFGPLGPSPVMFESNHPVPASWRDPFGEEQSPIR